MKLNLKLVPWSEPNGDGFWIVAEIPTYLIKGGLNVFSLTVIKDHAVVSYNFDVQDLQDGGPQHAQYLYQKPAKYQFDPSWVKEE